MTYIHDDFSKFVGLEISCFSFLLFNHKTITEGALRRVRGVSEVWFRTFPRLWPLFPFFPLSSLFFCSSLLLSIPLSPLSSPLLSLLSYLLSSLLFPLPPALPLLPGQKKHTTVYALSSYKGPAEYFPFLSVEVSKIFSVVSFVNTEIVTSCRLGDTVPVKYNPGRA